MFFSLCIKNQKNLSTPEIKATKKTLHELEESFSSLKKYYDYDDTKFKGIKNIENLFNEAALNMIDKDYYKPINPKSAFKNNYIEYESKGDKSKNLSPEEYLDITRPYLSEMINDHKTQSECKIQLTMQINFFLLKILKKLVLCIPRAAI